MRISDCFDYAEEEEQEVLEAIIGYLNWEPSRMNMTGIPFFGYSEMGFSTTKKAIKEKMLQVSRYREIAYKLMRKES